VTDMPKYVDAGNVDLDREVVRRKDGSRISEDDAAAQGARIAARGRPSLSGKSAHSPQIGVRLSPELHQRLRRRAEHDAKSPSEIVREALERYV
jgi:predicted HicB family RNase H-like nuclease